MRRLTLQRGDTIVEVLISIAVAGLVLAVTYSTMNRNLLISRDAQERTEATKIAQGQIELLKAHTDVGDPSVNSGTFCLDATASTARTGFSGGTPRNILPDDFAQYAPLCRGLGISGLYNVAIVANSGGLLGLYKVYVRWYSVQSNGQQAQIVMVYKL